MSTTPLRADLQIIADWIRPNSRVLDLGCGEGELLDYLQREKGVQAYGIELDEERIAVALRRGISVLQQDLDSGLRQFASNSVDTVVLSLTLQAVHYPRELLLEMLRVGREGIVTFPNMGHWRARWQLGLGGRMPMTDVLPHSWYDTPNIHLCTIRDFDALCRENRIEVRERMVLDDRRRSTAPNRVWPNLLAELALYRCARPD